MRIACARITSLACCFENFLIEILITFTVPFSRMPELLVRALARHDDFIVTCETDPDTGNEQIHMLSGKFVTSCMLRKLLGQAESQRDEGALVVSGKWV